MTQEQDTWRETQREHWRRIRLASISTWYGAENPTATLPGGSPIFTDPTSPFRQLAYLILRTDQAQGGEDYLITTYQDDDIFRLRISPMSYRTALESSTDDTSWRPASLVDLPLGPVEKLELREDRSERNEPRGLVEVTITIAQREILLIAGEVQEEDNAPPTMLWGDESVLLFTDAREADAIAWRPPRRWSTTEIHRSV